MTQTLQAAFDRRADQFDRLRLIAAIAVIFGHSYALSPGKPIEPLQSLLHGTYSGEIAVWMFFAISGFLVTMSAIERPDPWRFFIARVLRLWPAYFVCIMLTVLVLGPALTTSTQYFSEPITWQYLYGNLSYLRMTYFLPGVFEQVPFPAVNGSIWSLQLEVWCYFWVWSLGAFALLRPRRFGFALLLPSAATAAVGAAIGGFSPLLVPPLLCFLVGAILARYAPSIRLRAGWVCVLMLPAAIAWWFERYPIMVWLLAPAIAVATIWLAYRWPAQRPRWGDPSYGVYLYAFPIQQCVVYAWPSVGPLTMFAIAAPLSWLAGMASWHWIEKPALRFKSWPRPWIVVSAGKAD